MFMEVDAIFHILSQIHSILRTFLEHTMMMLIFIDRQNFRADMLIMMQGMICQGEGITTIALPPVVKKWR